MMYRNCKCKQCCLSNCKDYKEDVLENIPEAICPVTNLNNDCGCGFDEDSVFPENPMYGQSYVPWQVMNKTFTPAVGLKMGTIFPELVSPYVPCQGMEEIAYIKATNKIGEGCNR